MDKRFSGAENNETGAEACAEKHTYPCIKREFGLGVFSAELNVRKGTVDKHPAGKTNCHGSDKNNKPAEIGNNKTLNGTEKGISLFRGNKSESDNAGKNN